MSSSSSYTLSKYEQRLLPDSSGRTFQQRFITATRVGSFTLPSEDEKNTALFTVHETATTRLYRVVMKNAEIDELREQIGLSKDPNEVREIEKKIETLSNGIVMVIEASQSKQTGLLYIENIQKVMRAHIVPSYDVATFVAAAIVAISGYRMPQSIYVNISDIESSFDKKVNTFASDIIDIVLPHYGYLNVGTEEWEETDRQGVEVSRQIVRYDMKPAEVLRLQKLKQNK